MYDQSLEQLIDAVIADGIITDQERKVVYAKAASFGISPDEIEVYLNGRLDAFNNSNKSKSGKHFIFTPRKMICTKSHFSFQKKRGFFYLCRIKEINLPTG